MATGKQFGDVVTSQYHDKCNWGELHELHVLLIMIILSYNCRGLGRGIKWAAIRKLNLKHKVDLVCIQETKKENFNKLICQAIWGDSNVSWDSVPSVHTSGGLLCMWNNSVFEVDRRVKGRNFLMLVGRWTKDN